MTEHWRQIHAADGGAFQAYIAQPASPPRGAIVVIQEIFGVNEVMRGKCDWLAQQGYVALCPDLFWRLEPGISITDKTEAEWAKAFDYMQRFDIDQGVDDLAATADFARQHLNAAKVGAVGYCLGGLLAYLVGCRAHVDAAVGYYGVTINERLDEARTAATPIMLHIAEMDGFVPPPAQAEIEAGLKDHPNFVIHKYAGVDHAFAREGGKNWNAAAAHAANERTLAFFAANVG